MVCPDLPRPAVETLAEPRPRVLIVTRMSPRRDARNRVLVRALSPAFDIEIISESADRRTARVVDLEGARLTEVVLPPQGRGYGHLGGLLRVVKLNAHGVWRALTRNYDIVVCSDGIYALAGVFTRWLRRRTFVYNAHEILWALGYSRLFSMALGSVEWLSLRACHFWMVPSEARAEIIQKKHGLTKRHLVYENFPIVRTGPESRDAFRKRLVQAGIPPGRPVLMFQGSLNRRRGLEQIIQTARTGLFHFVVQGDGPISGDLRKNAHGYLTFLDPCPNDEAVSWLSAADLSFVYYENDGLNSAYASSGKFYASVFAGVPIVCNRLPSFEVFAARYGGVIFLESLERHAVVEGLSEVLSHRDKYEKLRRQILRARQELDKVPYEALILEAFRSIIAGGEVGDSSPNIR